MIDRRQPRSERRGFIVQPTHRCKQHCWRIHQSTGLLSIANVSGTNYCNFRWRLSPGYGRPFQTTTSSMVGCRGLSDVLIHWFQSDFFDTSWKVCLGVFLLHTFSINLGCNVYEELDWNSSHLTNGCWSLQLLRQLAPILTCPYEQIVLLPVSEVTACQFFYSENGYQRI